MTCEFFPGPCDECEIPHCHADVSLAEEQMLVKMDEVTRLSMRLSEAIEESRSAAARFARMRTENRQAYPGGP